MNQPQSNQPVAHLGVFHRGAHLHRVSACCGRTLFGEAFIPGEFMKDGTSREVVTVANDTLNGIVAVFRWIEANVEVVLGKVEECCGLRPAELRFKVGDLDWLIQGGLSLVEQNSGVMVYRRGSEIRYRYGAQGTKTQDQ